MKMVEERHPHAQFTVYMARAWKEAYGFVGSPQQKVNVQVPIEGRPTRLDITEPMRLACESIVEPIAETMLDLLPRIEPEYQERVRNNVILSGGTSLISGLRAALQEGLKPVGGGKVRNVKDPVYDGSDGCLALAMDAPDSDWDRLRG